MKTLVWFITGIIGTLFVAAILLPVSIMILIIIGPVDLVDAPASTLCFTDVIPDAMKYLWSKPRS